MITIANYEDHTPATGQMRDTQPGNYYVSVVNDQGQYRLLLGPFHNDHQAALDSVQHVRQIAEQLDRKAIWYSFGTCRVERQDGVPPHQGILNQHCNFAVPA